MNCFNGEAFLHQAIASVIAQTLSDWEIVFWDNQSTDSSAAIVNSYDDQRILYYYAPTHTLLDEARNCAIEKASGQLLAFLDVDDWWLPEKLEWQVAYFSDPDVSMVYGNYWVSNENKGSKRVAYKTILPAGHILDQLLEDYRVGLLTLMLRRSYLTSSKRPFDPGYHIIGDFDLVIRLASKYKVASVQAPIAVYRIHVDNETTLRKGKHIDELTVWCREMSQHPIIGRSQGFEYVTLRTEYINALGALLDGERLQAFKLFKSMRLGKHKLRLFVALLLPVIAIKQIKH